MAIPDEFKIVAIFCQGVSAQPLSFFISTSFSACFSYPNPPSRKDFTDCKNREDFGLSDLNVYFTVPMQTLEMNFYYWTLQETKQYISR